MSVKMIANRRMYSKSEGKEYEANQEFTVDDQREADKLIRLRRARMSTEGRAETPAPRRRGRPPNVAQPEPAPAQAAPEINPEPPAGTYLRSDMRAED